MTTYTREERRKLARDNQKMPLVLTDVPRSEWPINLPHGIYRVMRSRNFLVQFYVAEDGNVPIRLSICKTTVGESGERWADGISWDEIQQIKREAGYAQSDAVEIYPADRDVVNVANMRHLWIMPEPITFAWRKG